MFVVVEAVQQATEEAESMSFLEGRLVQWEAPWPGFSSRRFRTRVAAVLPNSVLLTGQHTDLYTTRAPVWAAFGGGFIPYSFM